MNIRNWSTVSALITVICCAFMAQPTIASLVVLMILVPLGLLVTIWLAHGEGWRKAKEHFTFDHKEEHK